MSRFIGRACPYDVRQTLENSCWAAVLESWSRVDPRLPRLNHDDLVDRWGEGSTGGITPSRTVPFIAAAFDLRYSGLEGGYLEGYLRLNMPTSHVFCAYTLPGYTHAVLIYQLGQDRLAFFDPNGAVYRVRDIEWIEQRGPFVVMAKP
jgi:hypothetical protein